MNRTGRPSISNSSCRSCYLLVSKGITCIRNSRVQSIPRPVFRFTNGYQKLRRMNFYSPERERERASSEVSSRESSFVVRDERHSVPGESIKFASYAIVRERISSFDQNFVSFTFETFRYPAFRKDFVLYRVEKRKKYSVNKITEC